MNRQFMQTLFLAVTASIWQIEPKKGGGIAIIHRDSLRVHHEPIQPLSSFEHTSIVITNISPQLRVTGIYCPPNTSSADTFESDLNALLENYNKSTTDTCLLGDFNVRFQDNSNPFTKILNTTLVNFNLVQHVSVPTHSKGNTLNLVITPIEL